MWVLVHPAGKQRMGPYTWPHLHTYSKDHESWYTELTRMVGHFYSPDFILKNARILIWCLCVAFIQTWNDTEDLSTHHLITDWILEKPWFQAHIMKQLMSYPVVLESWESVQGNQNATTFRALVDSMRKNVHRSHGCLLVIELERGVAFCLNLES